MKHNKKVTIEPLYVGWEGFARLSGIAVSTLQNRLSLGQLTVKPRYFGTRPLFAVAEIRAMLENLPTEPTVKRGRKPKYAVMVKGGSSQ